MPERPCKDVDDFLEGPGRSYWSLKVVNFSRVPDIKFLCLSYSDNSCDISATCRVGQFHLGINWCTVTAPQTVLFYLRTNETSQRRLK